MAIGVILSFIQIFTIGYGGIFLALFSAAINLYVFICVYSLYDKFRNEKLGINTSGQVAPGTQRTIVYVQPQHPQPYGIQQAQPYGAPVQQPYGAPYQSNQQYLQQSTTYITQPPVYTQQAHIQAVSAESQVAMTETSGIPKTAL